MIQSSSFAFPLNLDESVIFPPSSDEVNQSINPRTTNARRKDQSFDSLYRTEIENFIDHGTEKSFELSSDQISHTSQYSIVRVDFIGRGSSASVYKSVLVNSPKIKLCAEKVVVSGNPAKRIQLIRELESLKFSLITKTKNFKSESPVNHDANSTNSSIDGSQYIVNLLDVIPNIRDGTLSVCLEYMDGGSLQDIIALGGCDNERVLFGIANQMTRGLSFLHSLRIIHRDLKPANTLFSSSGVVKLADFGLAKTLDKGRSLADSFIGTFDYMAPERLQGQSYNFVSDIWSLGMTLHAVAIGCYPYHKDRGYWTLLNALQDEDILLPSFDKFSPVFIDFISKACTKDMDYRPKASELLLHTFMTTLPIDPQQTVELNAFPSSHSDLSFPSFIPITEINANNTKHISCDFFNDTDFDEEIIRQENITTSQQQEEKQNIQFLKSKIFPSKSRYTNSNISFPKNLNHKKLNQKLNPNDDFEKEKGSKFKINVGNLPLESSSESSSKTPKTRNKASNYKCSHDAIPSSSRTLLRTQGHHHHIQAFRESAEFLKNSLIRKKETLINNSKKTSPTKTRLPITLTAPTTSRANMLKSSNNANSASSISSTKKISISTISQIPKIVVSPVVSTPHISSSSILKITTDNESSNKPELHRPESFKYSSSSLSSQSKSNHRYQSHGPKSLQSKSVHSINHPSKIKSDKQSHATPNIPPQSFDKSDDTFDDSSSPSTHHHSKINSQSKFHIHNKTDRFPIQISESLKKSGNRQKSGKVSPPTVSVPPLDILENLIPGDFSVSCSERSHFTKSKSQNNFHDHKNRDFLKDSSREINNSRAANKINDAKKSAGLIGDIVSAWKSFHFENISCPDRKNNVSFKKIIDGYISRAHIAKDNRVIENEYDRIKIKNNSNFNIKDSSGSLLNDNYYSNELIDMSSIDELALQLNIDISALRESFSLATENIKHHALEFSKSKTEHVTLIPKDIEKTVKPSYYYHDNQFDHCSDGENKSRIHDLLRNEEDSNYINFEWDISCKTNSSSYIDDNESCEGNLSVVSEDSILDKIQSGDVILLDENKELHVVSLNVNNNNASKGSEYEMDLDFEDKESESTADDNCSDYENDDFENYED